MSDAEEKKTLLVDMMAYKMNKNLEEATEAAAAEAAEEKKPLLVDLMA